MYNDHIINYKDALSKAKSDKYANLIRFGDGNTRTLFSTVNTILRPTDTLAPNTATT